MGIFGSIVSKLGGGQTPASPAGPESAPTGTSTSPLMPSSPEASVIGEAAKVASATGADSLTGTGPSPLETNINGNSNPEPEKTDTDLGNTNVWSSTLEARKDSMGASTTPSNQDGTTQPDNALPASDASAQGEAQTTDTSVSAIQDGLGTDTGSNPTGDAEGVNSEAAKDASAAGADSLTDAEPSPLETNVNADGGTGTGDATPQTETNTAPLEPIAPIVAPAAEVPASTDVVATEVNDTTLGVGVTENASGAVAESASAEPSELLTPTPIEATGEASGVVTGTASDGSTPTIASVDVVGQAGQVVADAEASGGALPPAGTVSETTSSEITQPETPPTDLANESGPEEEKGPVESPTITESDPAVIVEPATPAGGTEDKSGVVAGTASDGSTPTIASVDVVGQAGQVVADAEASGGALPPAEITTPDAALTPDSNTSSSGSETPTGTPPVPAAV